MTHLSEFFWCVLVLVSVTSTASVPCVHDELEEPRIQFHRDQNEEANLLRNKASLRVSGSLRIHLDYTNFDNETIDADVKTFLKGTVIPLAAKVWETTLNVDRSDGNLFWGERQCDSRWDSGVNQGKCGPSMITPTCSSLVPIIPVDHIKPTDTCLLGTTTNSCTTMPYGSGIPNKDLIIYVTRKNSSICDSGALAFANFCTLDPTTDRPVAGYINVCASLLKVQTDYGDVANAVMMLTHELGHVLGFSKFAFKYWRNSAGLPRSVRDSSGAPVNTSETTVATVFERGFNVTKLVTENVVQAVRNHFNCLTAVGADLEDGGLGGASAGSHWEKKTFNSELMMADSSTLIPNLSPITLAALVDSGWYTIRSTAFQRTLEWGLRAGCGFLLSKCLSPGNPPNGSAPFCVDGSRRGCTNNRDSIGYCNAAAFSSALPTYFQYFTNNSAFGGADTILDYCPYIQGFSNRKCQRTSDGNRVTYWGISHGPSSLCYETTLFDTDYIAPGTTMFDCYTSRCVNGTVQVSVANNWYTCDNAGKNITVPGYSGRLVCPSADLIPLMCQRMEVLFPCLLNNTCNATDTGTTSTATLTAGTTVSLAPVSTAAATPLTNLPVNMTNASTAPASLATVTVTTLLSATSTPTAILIGNITASTTAVTPSVSTPTITTAQQLVCTIVCNGTTPITNSSQPNNTSISNTSFHFTDSAQTNVTASNQSSLASNGSDTTNATTSSLNSTLLNSSTNTTNGTGQGGVRRLLQSSTTSTKTSTATSTTPSSTSTRTSTTPATPTATTTATTTKTSTTQTSTQTSITSNATSTSSSPSSTVNTTAQAISTSASTSMPLGNSSTEISNGTTPSNSSTLAPTSTLTGTTTVTTTTTAAAAATSSNSSLSNISTAIPTTASTTIFPTNVSTSTSTNTSNCFQVCRLVDVTTPSVPFTLIPGTSSSSCPTSMYGPACNIFCDRISTCLGRGTCQPKTGLCVCDVSYFGSQCGVYLPPSSFSKVVVTPTLGGDIFFNAIFNNRSGSISVPPGSVTANVTITVNAFENAPITTPPATLTAYSPTFHFGPSGTVFSKSIQISLPLPSVALTSRTSAQLLNFALYTFDDGTTSWVKINSSVLDLPNKQITALLDHFSLYMVMESNQNTTATVPITDPVDGTSLLNGNTIIFIVVAIVVFLAFIFILIFVFRRLFRRRQKGKLDVDLTSDAFKTDPLAMPMNIRPRPRAEASLILPVDQTLSVSSSSGFPAPSSQDCLLQVVAESRHNPISRSIMQALHPNSNDQATAFRQLQEPPAPFQPNAAMFPNDSEESPFVVYDSEFMQQQPPPIISIPAPRSASGNEPVSVPDGSQYARTMSFGHLVPPAAEMRVFNMQSSVGSEPLGASSSTAPMQTDQEMFAPQPAQLFASYLGHRDRQISPSTISGVPPEMQFLPADDSIRPAPSAMNFEIETQQEPFISIGGFVKDSRSEKIFLPQTRALAPQPRLLEESLPPTSFRVDPPLPLPALGRQPVPLPPAYQFQER